jgi:Zn-dependent protease with chaperone function
VEPYPQISSKAYQHPADRAATAALHAVPMLDTVVRRLVEFRYERALRQSMLGSSVQIGERQLPDVWAAYCGVARILDMPADNDVYVSSSVNWNALTIGSKRPMIVLGSNLLTQLGPGEQRVVIAHELGHVLSDHVLYTTALNILLAAGSGLPLGLGLPVRAVRAVLLEWVRAAELSCDRAATLAVRDPQIVCRTLMVLAGGLPADRDLGGQSRPGAPLLQRAGRHPRQRRAPGLGGDALGSKRRVRPHPARRVHAPRGGERRAGGGR